LPPTATAHVRLHSTTGRSTTSHRTRPMHTGPMHRELRKLAGSPDASHRMHPERPVLTGLMRREGRQNDHTPDTEHRTHSGASGALWTDPTIQRTLKASVRCLHAVRPMRLPRLLPISHRRNRKCALNFLKPTPLSTLGTPPPLQSVPTPPSASVLAFLQIFSRRSSPLNLPRHSILTRMQS